MISLSLEDLVLQLNPEVGGSVSSFTRGDTPVLRTAPAGSTNPLDQAAYPLIPFSGRIEQGQFRFNNRQVTLPSNMPPEPHAIHGQGWQSEWQVQSQNGHAATLILDYLGTDWPWRYRARQTFELSANALNVTMSLQNLAPQPMPAGLGWHPFFPKQDARLTADVDLIWPSDSDMISQPPIHSAEVDTLNQGTLVRELALDNAFTAKHANARIHWATELRSVSLQASEEFGHLVIYTPPQKNFFCVEPVSHAPNCFNSSLPAEVTGARTLASQQTMTAHVKLLLT